MKTYKYKLRIYYTKGLNRGQLKKEEYFYNKESAVKRYKELFNYDLFGLNPTLWIYKGSATYSESDLNGWKRIEGY